MKRTTQAARQKPRQKPTTQSSTLEKGQIWKMGETYVQITDAGKRLVHYKIAKTLNHRGLWRHLASIKTVQTFLKSNRAELVVKS